MTDKTKANDFNVSQDIYELNVKLNRAKSVQEMLGILESFKFYLMTQLKQDKGSSGGWLAKLGDNIRGWAKS